MGVKYNQIGIGYNQTRKADSFLTDRLYHFLNPIQNGAYLDIGCGTGNYTIALFQKGLRISGIDPSDEMLNVAHSKNGNIDWIIGRAENIPKESESIDGIICCLTIHHWSDLKKGFHELYRVLRPGGKLVVFTSTPEQMAGYWLNHYFPKMLKDSMLQMPSHDVVLSAMRNEGFSSIEIEKYYIKSDLEDMFLYAGKHNPSLYLDSQIRNGISSFSSLANTEEVAVGLYKLKKDIVSNAIVKTIERYSNDLGDYLYFITQKG